MSEGLAQSPYRVARVGFKLVTFWMEGTELTTEPPRPTLLEVEEFQLSLG